MNVSFYIQDNLSFKIPIDYFIFLNRAFFRELSEIAEFVEKSGTEVLRARDEWGYTPAHWVALDGNVEVMRYIVDRGAPIDLHCLGTQGPRPIHWACRKGNKNLLLNIRYIQRGPINT